MFEQLLTILPNLSIGVVAILALVYIVSMFEKHRKEEQAVFMEYVNTNNHKFTDLVVKSISAIEGASKSIEKNTEILEGVGENIKTLFELMIREIKK